MKYRNASEIFPDELLREIQKYTSGELLYIPKGEEEPAGWGEKSGAKAYFRERNAGIREKHKNGAGIRELAEEYGLSEESIRRIVYR